MHAKQAIETKKLGVTERNGARIVATSASGIKVTIDYPYELSGVNCHAKAAEKLARQLKWIEPEMSFSQQYAAGATKTGYVFVDRG